MSTETRPKGAANTLHRRLASFVRGHGAVVAATLLFLLGVAYRATFIRQGFAPTDEGWVQSMGARISAGQVPYRDFYYVFPPVTIYKEALLVDFFGSSYGILESRWAFVFEVSLASAMAFLLLRRFVGTRPAFLATLPTIFFSAQLIYMSNYTYDAEILALAALTSLTLADQRRWLRLVAGVLAGLSVMSKQPFLLVLPILVLLGILASISPQRERFPALRSLAAGWPSALVGALVTIVVMTAYLGSVAGLSQVAYQVLTLTRQGHPSPLSFYLWQDIPEYLGYWGKAGSVTALLLLTASLVRVGRLFRPLQIAALVLAVSAIWYRTLPPQPARPFMLVVGLWVIFALNLVGLGMAVVGSVRKDVSAAFPPELPLLGLGLQYMAQYTYSGAVFYYIGCFVSVPVALLVVHALARKPVSILGPPAAAAWLLGAWLSVGSVLVLWNSPYEDAPRWQLSAGLSSPRLAGLLTRPAEAEKINRIVAEVNRYSRPGDAVLFFPDFAALYFATGRSNPTREDWYDASLLTPEIAAQAVADLKLRPPTVAFLETQTEGDFKNPQQAPDYGQSAKLGPIVDFLRQNYHEVDRVQDVIVLRPNS